jgi:trans-aconitate 2-methyltransferase
MWDPDQYLRFAGERARPFFDLVAAISHPDPATVVDLGCGPGGLTATLTERWPDARIVGIDRSAEMIARARHHAIAGRLTFMEGDVSTWQESRPVDVVLSNACFHWVPDHHGLLDRLISQLAPGGVLAFQVPDNSAEPSHCLLRQLVMNAKWSDRLAQAPAPAVAEADWYVRYLAGRGLRVNAWETTYHHILQGPHAVLEWVRGTTLRPLLELLSAEQAERFLSAYGELLEQVYPQQKLGTIFRFHRIFVVARTE